ncbi:MAG: 16S rRNA (cytidine(1402)-2'-O)-methyltransferase, partial [Alistipes sp.]|nr:16S rRNA (cytidine(1402)-2'-O)-methyltransferase [Alistipes sp.]
VSRELTKKFEQTVRGTLAEVAAHFKSHQPKGEFVIVLAGKGLKSRAAETVEEDGEDDEQ